MKKIFIVMLMLSVLLVVGCSSDTESDVNSVSNGDPVFESGDVKEINVEAFKFGFEPSVIEVNYGDKVKIIGNSRDVPHSFAISEFGVNLYLDGISENTVEFIASERGEFAFFCNVPCGRGHGNMRGKFIVK